MSGDSTRLQGQQAESVVEFMANRYQAAGIATLWKQGTICIPTRRGWQPIHSLPDFGGVLHGSGRAIAFDVKSSTTLLYHHPKDRAHQLEHLWKVDAAGGIAGLLIQSLNSEFGERWFWVRPMPEWENGETPTVVLATTNGAICHIPNWPEVSEPFPNFLHPSIIERR